MRPVPARNGYGEAGAQPSLRGVLRGQRPGLSDGTGSIFDPARTLPGCNTQCVRHVIENLDPVWSWARGERMRRRQFLSLLGGAAASYPLAARAQQSGMRRVGVLMSTTADDAEGQDRVGAFLQGLRQAGWAVPGNVYIDTRWGAGDAERIHKYAAELLALAPDVILASGGAVAGPLLKLTRTVPIVFTLTPDPVGAGFVQSLAHPGGNATGFTSIEYGIEREMAGTDARHRARRDARGGPAPSHAARG